MKKFKYFLIFFFVISCDYTPIYNVGQNSNLKLDKINYAGDKKLGRSIIKGIERLKNNKSINVYDLNFISSKKESVVSKDKKGNVSTYKMIIEVGFNLKSKNNDKVLSKKFSKATTYNSTQASATQTKPRTSKYLFAHQGWIAARAALPSCPHKKL